MNKEELRNVDGSDSLHPNRSGDVVVVLRPPYQSDARHGEPEDRAVALLRAARLPAEHVDLKNNINMHATFVMGGPGFKDKKNVKGLRAIDVAPTIAFLMGIPGPQQARGAILYDLVKHAENLDRDHDPRHQRLARTADAARRDGGHGRPRAWHASFAHRRRRRS